jgi:putative transposase
VTFSNSMIEAFWRSMKHQWLFLNRLESVAQLRNLVAFFVDEHNAKMPHAAFHGHTPDEKYFGHVPNLAGDLAVAREHAVIARLAANRSISCSRCFVQPMPPAIATLP